MKARWPSMYIAILMIIGASQALSQEELSGEELARQSGCLECHSVDQKVVGPAYRDIAARYKDVDNARAALIEKIKRGGKGNWTEITRGIPMPPHSARLTDAEVQRLVDWVMSL